jgi:hypothetical protein
VNTIAAGALIAAAHAEAASTVAPASELAINTARLE